MKKFLKRLTRAGAATAIIALFGGFSFEAYAQTEVDLGNLTIGEQYDADGRKTTIGHFTAPASGEAQLELSQNASIFMMALYSDEERTDEVMWSFNDNYQRPAYVFDVTEGETYYLYINRMFNTGNVTFKLFMEGIVERPFYVTDTNPRSGRNVVYNLTYDPNMFLRFSTDVGDATVSLAYQANSGSDITVDITDYSRIQTSYVYIRLAEKLEELLNDASGNGIKPLAPFIVKIKATNKTGKYATDADADGWIENSYLCGYIPTRVISANWPKSFLSYWPKGDEAGMATITYSGELRTTPAPTVTLAMGNPEGDPGVDYYRSSFPAKVEGNTIYVDLTGVRRSYSDMFSSNVTYDAIMVQISGIYNSDGVVVESNFPGGMGQYNINLPFNNLERGIVATEFVPTAGSKLTNTKELEVWISGLQYIQFDGFTFRYFIGNEEKFIDIPMSDITVTDEFNDEEAAFTFEIPSEVKTADAVYVYPTNLTSINGYDYSANLEAAYNTLVLTSLEPKNGDYMAALTGSTVTATFNYSASYPDMYVKMEIIDENDQENPDKVVYQETPMTRTGDTYSIAIDGKLKLYNNHEYSAVFTAWESESDCVSGKKPLGSATATWFGTTPPYINSYITFSGITPDDETELSETNGTFTLSFSGLVKIDNTNSYYTPFGVDSKSFTITPTGDNTFTNPDNGVTYADKWILKVDNNYLSTDYKSMTLTVVVVDEENRRVNGNELSGEDTYFEFIYYNGPHSAVEEFETEAEENYKLYNLNGVLLLEGIGKPALDTLAPGIYIVNGKKIKI